MHSQACCESDFWVHHSVCVSLELNLPPFYHCEEFSDVSDWSIWEELRLASLWDVLVLMCKKTPNRTV